MGDLPVSTSEQLLAALAIDLEYSSTSLTSVETLKADSYRHERASFPRLQPRVPDMSAERSIHLSSEMDGVHV